jgi:hypothetical protein
MKLTPVMILLFVVSFSTNAAIHLYSRALAEKHVTDSIKAIDSSRVADSLRIATRISDSMMVDRYRAAEKDLKTEKIKEQKALEAFKPVAVDSSVPIIQDDVDDISARTVVIDQNNKYAAEIDSLQKKTDSIYNSIYDQDPLFKKMKTFPVSEKRRYMIYLMKNNLKDTTAIQNCCNQLFQAYSSKIDLLVAIRNSQTNNTKSFMTNQIEIFKQRMAELSNFIVALSAIVPSPPQHQTGQSLQ